LRHRATNRKVAGSIPDCVVENFHGHNLSGRTLTVRSTQPLTENEYQEYFLRGKGGRYLRLTELPPSCADCLKICEPQFPGTLRACQGLSRDCFTFVCMYIAFQTFFYAVRHLDSTYSHLPTGLRVSFFRSWPSLFLSLIIPVMFSITDY
jgi:hypothetical protein